MLLACLLHATPAAYQPAVRLRAANGHARARAVRLSSSATPVPAVPIEHTEPAPELTPREVITSMNSALHRSNWDAPSPYYGFEVALRFLAPTHMAKINRAKPGGYARFLRQPHKLTQIMWNEFRFEGDLIMLESPTGVDEAYQMCSVRAAPTDEWTSVRWKLVKVSRLFLAVVEGREVEPDDEGATQWMVEAVFSREPDHKSDDEYLSAEFNAKKPEQDGASSFIAELRAIHGEEVERWVAPPESPQQVVGKVMRALREDALSGAAIATRYCSPRNRASELQPEVFARYLSDPWYSILAEWDEIEEEEEDDEDEDDGTTEDLEVDITVRREGEDTFSMVSWRLSLYNGQWLIDSMNVI